MTNYNKAIKKGLEEFDNTFDLLHQTGMQEAEGIFINDDDKKLVKQFITTFAEQIREATIKDNINIVGVSQWRELGKKLGYWDYFEKQMRKIKNFNTQIPNDYIKELIKLAKDAIENKRLAFDGFDNVYNVEEVDNLIGHILSLESLINKK